MKRDKTLKEKKSLGALRKADKTKERSPDLQGQLHLQHHTLSAFVKQFKETEEDEVICNLAGWRNIDKYGNTYITVELSSRFVPRKQRASNSDVFDGLFDDED
jgi:hypothetical protein